MSDHTRRQVDEEQQYLTDLAHRRAMRIVDEHRPLLDALATTLLENEVLEREDIERLVAEHRGETNGIPPVQPAVPVVPVEPGPATVTAAERAQPQPGGDSPS
jgi:cell division protease FtsH